VTFLRTDVEGSMALALAHGAAWDGINGAHLDLLRDAVRHNAGVVVRTEGDALFAAFPEAGAGVRAAIAGQQAIAGHAWPAGATVAVRMGLHTGEAHLAGDDYGGFDVNRVARIAAVGHGGQIVVSGTTRSLVEGSLPNGVTLRDLGRHALRDVPAPEQLFQVEAPGLRSSFPQLRVATPQAGNLPDRLTSFLGRERELAELDALLETARLVTLTGPGGIGKTSLAIELARRRADRAADGAWVVALDGIADPALVSSVIARTLGLFDGADHPAVDALPGFLSTRSMALVLDNFEHLLEAAGTVGALVRAAPTARFIVTSRAPLRVQGEHEYPVAPLTAHGSADGAGEETDPAIGLFVDRVQAVRPGWTLSEADRPIVTEICERLDGLPLGIELAAARMALMPATAIRDRLAAHLPLPGTGPRDAPARQQTLDGAIGWSHDLLTEDEQRLLHDLSVFEAGFDLSEVERVAADQEPSGVLDGLVALAEQSLIARQPIDPVIAEYPAGSGIRFLMLRTVQDFAARRLAEDGREADVRRRHAMAYLDLAETAAAHLPSSTQPPWLDRLGVDWGNIRAAIRWAIDTGEVELAMRFVAGMWRWWQLDGHLVEGRALAEEILGLPGAEAHTAARLGAVTAAGGLAYWQGDRDTTNRWYRDQLALAEELGDVPASADAWLNLASSNFIRGDPAEAIRCGTEARRLFVELGDERGINRIDWGFGNMTMFTTGLEDGRSKLLEVRRRAVELDDAIYVAIAGGSLAWTAYMAGDPVEASRWALETVLELYRLRDVAGATISLPSAAIAAMELGRVEEAAVVMGAFDALCERYGVRPPIGLAEMIGRAEPTAQLADLLTPEVLAAATARGHRMSLDEAVAIAVDLLAELPPARIPD
jgi:predicted ATPase/class 3 adenylate cyclase